MPGEVVAQDQLQKFLLDLHKQNAEQANRTNSLLLDLNERLATSEVSARHADEARMMLLSRLEKLNDKMEVLGTIPLQMTALSKEVEEVSATVKRHEATFNRLEGGWFVARIAWVVIAAGISLLVSVVMNYVFKKGG